MSTSPEQWRTDPFAPPGGVHATVVTGRSGPGRPRPRLALAAALLLVGVIVEIWAVLAVAHWIGVFWTLALLVLVAVLGGWLVRREGPRTWRALGAALRGGSLPVGELADAVLVLVGAALLIVPGFVSDLVALVFIVPFTRPVGRWLFGLVLGRRIAAVNDRADLLRARMDPSSTVPTTATDPATDSHANTDSHAKRPSAGSTEGRVIPGELAD